MARPSGMAVQTGGTRRVITCVDSARTSACWRPRHPTLSPLLSWPRLAPQGIVVGNGNGNGNGGGNTTGLHPAAVRWYSSLLLNCRLTASSLGDTVSLGPTLCPLSQRLEWVAGRAAAGGIRRVRRRLLRRLRPVGTKWVTFNEPWVVALLGMGKGKAPIRGMRRGLHFAAGHHILLAHAAAVAAFRALPTSRPWLQLQPRPSVDDWDYQQL